MSDGYFFHCSDRGMAPPFSWALLSLILDLCLLLTESDITLSLIGTGVLVKQLSAKKFAVTKEPDLKQEISVTK